MFYFVLKILAFHLLFIAIDALTNPTINSRGLSLRVLSAKKFYSLSGLHSEKSPSKSPEIGENDSGTKNKLRIAVIGGGWAGYSLCESISTNNLPTERGSRGGIEIIMLDASKQAKGGLAGGYRDETKNNRPVEAGIHGFWREYRNTFDIMESIEGVKVDEVLGGFSPSVLYSKNGKVAVAPVLLDEEEMKESNFGKMPVIKDVSEKSIRRFIATNLPPPLDLPLLAEINNNTDRKGGGSKLRPIDLMSGLGLVGAWADFEQESRVSWKRYDTQPASLLFEKAGITDALYEEMVSPLLHVLPMCPAYDCSAAAALSCFHVFALQSRGAFDVRWCRGSISEKIFDLWQHQLEQRGVSIRGGSRVASIKKNDDGKYDISLDSMNEKTENSLIENCDAVVLAVGAVAAGKLAASSPALSSLDATKDFDKLRGVTCVAVRLFLKPHPTITSGLKGGLHDKTQLPPEFAKAMIDSPIAVCGAGIGGIEELRETGFCIYDLQRMHDEFSVDHYALHIDKEDQVSVLEIDFYRADSFVNCQNDVIVSLALEAVSSALGTASKIDQSGIVDSTILRAKNAVSHFSPNSALYSPDVKLDKGLYCCGDWVDRTGHASWSTEKSVVTARQAANALSADFRLANSQCDVIPAAKDTPQLTALRKSAKLLRTLLPLETLPPSPWVFAKQFLSRHV
mmetsp:Transcript_6337/g.12847  ORF Transcript_6337/g.12847 Transcript_6337/m.12847 type:complete len:682 (+) Transcript_6337:109-2154(+)